jgi:hypothetical protein
MSEKALFFGGRREKMIRVKRSWIWAEITPYHLFLVGGNWREAEWVFAKKKIGMTYRRYKGHTSAIRVWRNNPWGLAANSCNTMTQVGTGLPGTTSCAVWTPPISPHHVPHSSLRSFISSLPLSLSLSLSYSYQMHSCFIDQRVSASWIVRLKI